MSIGALRAFESDRFRVRRLRSDDDARGSRACLFSESKDDPLETDDLFVCLTTVEPSWRSSCPPFWSDEALVFVDSAVVLDCWHRWKGVSR